MVKALFLSLGAMEKFIASIDGDEVACQRGRRTRGGLISSVRSRDGEVVLKQPRVDLALCVGCGICETHCPIAGKPAIYVISAGESRSRDNQILL